MTYRVYWSYEAGRSLLEIREYIASGNPGAASRVASAIKECANSLQALPHLGKPGRIKGTRELVLPNLPWIIGYCADDKSRSVTILHIHHYAQLRN